MQYVPFRNPELTTCEAAMRIVEKGSADGDREMCVQLGWRSRPPDLMAFFNHSPNVTSNVNKFSYATCVLPSTELRAVLPSTRSQCSRCLKTKYCPTECQRTDWLTYPQAKTRQVTADRHLVGWRGVMWSGVEWMEWCGVGRGGMGRGDVEWGGC